MKVMVGQSHRVSIENNQYVDISYYPSKWTTTVNMGLWEEGNGVALACEEKTYFNFEKIMPLKWASKLGMYLLNQQSYRVAGRKLAK